MVHAVLEHGHLRFLRIRNTDKRQADVIVEVADVLPTASRRRGRLQSRPWSLSCPRCPLRRPPCRPNVLRPLRELLQRDQCVDHRGSAAIISEIPMNDSGRAPAQALGHELVSVVYIAFDREEQVPWLKRSRIDAERRHLARKRGSASIARAASAKGNRRAL